MVLVHGLLVILDSRRFSPVEVRRWVGPCTMGESRLTSWVEISHQVSGIVMVKAKILRPKSQIKSENQKEKTNSTLKHLSIFIPFL